MLCNLFWLDNTLVKIHECLRVAHTQRNCRDLADSMGNHRGFRLLVDGIHEEIQGKFLNWG